MKIIIKATNLELTGPLQVYIEDKIGGLDKFLQSFEGDNLQVRVEVGRLTRHHQHGEVYHVDANLDLPGKVLRAEEDGEDVRAAIDAVKGKLRREIEKYKTK
jgi:putative sigma-54 modulation protein